MWAEMWGLLSGLKLAKEMVFANVIVEMDSKATVDSILKWHVSNPALQFLLEEIQAFLRSKDY